MNEALLATGNQQIQAQDYSGAIATFTQLIQGDQFCGEAFYRRGVAHYRNNNVHEAVSDYGKALDLDSQNSKAYYGRALARLTLNNAIGAMKDVDEAIRWQGDYAGAYKLRATIHRRQANYPRAIDDFKKAAKYYIEQRKGDEAKDCIESVEKIQAKVRQTQEYNKSRSRKESWTEKHYFQHVENMAREGNTQRAMDDINWVLRSNSQDGKAYCSRGLIHLRKGNARAAIGDFNQAIALNYLESIVYRSRSQARLQLEDFAGAVEDCNQALSIHKEALSFVARGNAYRMLNDYMRAIQDYDDALGVNDSCGEAFLERGMTYEAMQKYQEAMTDYQQAIRLFCTCENWTGHRQAQVRLKVAEEALAEKQGQDQGLKTFARRYQALLKKVGGNQKIVEAILKRKKEKYPGRTEEWYLESAIEDLDNSEPDFWGRV